MNTTFSTPFAYFVFLHWSFFVFAMITYITVFYLTHWKEYFDLGR